MRGFKHPRLVEAGLWGFVLILAALFGALVAPGHGRPEFTPHHGPRTECAAWVEIEQREVPTGRLLGTIEYCREWTQ